MATLEKLAIMGIRSFGCDEGDTQKIRFQKPLTLILGENGCGKSTIIECLRSVTTLKDPGKGAGAFIHDPNLTNGSTVKSSIKLQMSDSKGNTICLSRQMQATKTKKSITTKSLDNVIARRDKVTNKEVCISNKCADLALEAARIFGVSKAILENVIFCTQEDSHWPLDTDQKLKEKFDQIFDSDKYNKAVNKVRDKKKSLFNEEKISSTELKYLKENKLMAAGKNNQLKKLGQEVEDSQHNLQKLKDKEGPLEEKLREVHNREMELSRTHTQKETKKEQLKGVEGHVADLKSRVKQEFTGSDEELKDKMDGFGRQLADKSKEVDKIDTEVASCTKQEADIQHKMMIDQGNLGQLQKEQEMHKEIVANRNRKLLRLAAELGVDNSNSQPSQLADDTVIVMMNQAQRKTAQKESDLKQLRETLDKEENTMQENVDKARVEHVSAQSAESNKSAKLAETRESARKLKREISAVDESATRLSRIEIQLSQTNEELNELQKVGQPKDELKELSEQRKKTDDKLTQVEADVSELQKHSTLMAELDLQTNQKNNREEELRRMKNKHEDNLESLLGRIPEQGFKAAVQTCADGLRKRMKELASQQARKEKELTELEMNRRHLKDQIQKKEDSMRVSEEDIYDQCGSADLEETISSLNSQIQELQDVKGALSSSEFMYSRYIRTLQKPQPCCPLCHRNFDRSNDAQTLIDELQGKVQEVPEKLSESSAQLDAKQTRYKKLLTLMPTSTQLSALRTVEIPALKAEFDATDSKLQDVREELAKLKADIGGPSIQETLCNSILGDMSLIDQQLYELKKAEGDVERLRLKVPPCRGDGITLHQALQEQENLRRTLKRVSNRMMEVQEALNKHNDQVQHLQATKNSLMEEMAKIEGGVGQRKQLEDNLAELQDLEVSVMEELDDLKMAVVAAKQQLNDLSLRKDNVKRKNEDTMEEARRQVAMLQKQLDDVKHFQASIVQYQNKGITRKLEAVIAAIRNCETTKEEVKKKRENALTKLNELKKDVNMQQVRERELADNWKLREKRREAETLGKEVLELEEKFGKLGYESLLREKRKLKADEEHIAKERSRIQGSVGGLLSQIESLEKELGTASFRNIDLRYRKEFIKNEVLRATQKDLVRYATAMEFAMLTYHKEQMNKVNAFIREYWRKIYQGNDVDYIEIQTDEMQSGEKRRNYNYRVVQVKGDTALDMRNKCSAGQKMLASLIIRMALSETFSSNCGILTLDEPTTNLDSRNKKFLALTLNDIITSKQELGMASPNFQLIVITHDEEFLQELMRVEAVNEYIKVERNHRGKSRVSCQVANGTFPLLGRGMELDRNNYEYD